MGKDFVGQTGKPSYSTTTRAVHNVLSSWEKFARVVNDNNNIRTPSQALILNALEVDHNEVCTNFLGEQADKLYREKGQGIKHLALIFEPRHLMEESEATLEQEQEEPSPSTIHHIGTWLERHDIGKNLQILTIEPISSAIQQVLDDSLYDSSRYYAAFEATLCSVLQVMGRGPNSLQSLSIRKLRFDRFPGDRVGTCLQNVLLNVPATDSPATSFHSLSLVDLEIDADMARRLGKGLQGNSGSCLQNLVWSEAATEFEIPHSFFSGLFDGYTKERPLLHSVKLDHSFGARTGFCNFLPHLLRLAPSLDNLLVHLLCSSSWIEGDAAQQHRDVSNFVEAVQEHKSMRSLELEIFSHLLEPWETIPIMVHGLILHPKSPLKELNLRSASISRLSPSAFLIQRRRVDLIEIFDMLLHSLARYRSVESLALQDFHCFGRGRETGESLLEFLRSRREEDCDDFRRLEIIRCTLEDSTEPYWIDGLKLVQTGLQELLFTRCGLSNTLVVSIVQNGILSSGMPLLRKLSFQASGTSGSLSSSSLPLFTKALQQLPNLEYLDLSSHPRLFEEETTEETEHEDNENKNEKSKVEAFFEALEKNTRLVSLFITFGAQREKTLHSTTLLFQALQVNSTLEELHIRHTYPFEIHPDWTEKLGHMKGLLHLSLPHIPNITEKKHWNDFLTSFQQNMVLTSFSFERHGYTNSSCPKPVSRITRRNTLLSLVRNLNQNTNHSSTTRTCSNRSRLGPHHLSSSLSMSLPLLPQLFQLLGSNNGEGTPLYMFLRSNADLLSR